LTCIFRWYSSIICCIVDNTTDRCVPFQYHMAILL